MSQEWERFFEKSPKFNGFKNNQSFYQLFHWLMEPEQISAMIEACRYGRPALEGVLEPLLQKYGQQEDLPMVDFNKQMIGRAIKDILWDFGYVQTVQKRIVPHLNQVFKSATVYEYNPYHPQFQNHLPSKDLVIKPQIVPWTKS